MLMKIKHWTREELRLLGTASDEKIARRLGRTVRSVKRKRQRIGIHRPKENVFTEKEKRLLGTMRDEKLAAKLGRARITIIRWRLKLGIACFAAKRRRWTRRELNILARYPDAVVARRLNRDVNSVRAKRLVTQLIAKRKKRRSKT